MKKILLLILLVICGPLFSQTKFSASLIRNGTYLSIRLVDSHLIPPFEAGDLWKILRGNEQIKMIHERELVLKCEGSVTQTNDTVGNCQLLFPYNLFQKMGNKMVFKAEGEMAARLNRYFIDSAYLSMQNDGIYLSSHNSRMQFFFGINEDLIKR